MQAKEGRCHCDGNDECLTDEEGQSTDHMHGTDAKDITGDLVEGLLSGSAEGRALFCSSNEQRYD